MKFFLLINVKMPTIVGILTFMSGKNSILGLSEPKKAEFLHVFTLMSIWNFILDWVEHKKSFITSRLDHYEDDQRLVIRPHPSVTDYYVLDLIACLSLVPIMPLATKVWPENPYHTHHFLSSWFTELAEEFQLSLWRNPGAIPRPSADSLHSNHSTTAHLCTH